MKNVFKRFSALIISATILGAISLSANAGVELPDENIGSVTINNSDKTISGDGSCFIYTFIHDMKAFSKGFTAEVYENGKAVTNGYIKDGMTAKLYTKNNGEFFAEYTFTDIGTDENFDYEAVAFGDVIDNSTKTISDIHDGITVKEFSDKLNTWGNLSSAEVYYDGEKVTDGYIKNGSVVKINDINGDFAGEYAIEKFEEIPVESIGDVYADNQIDIMDVTVTRAYIVGNTSEYEVDGICVGDTVFDYATYKKADFSQDAKIDITDIVLMRSFIVNN